MTPVRLERDGDVAVITLDNPPLNLFERAVMDGLDDATEDLQGAVRSFLEQGPGHASYQGR